MAEYRPVFIIGTGRCGSQLFYRMMAHHKAFRWFSNLEEVHPDSELITFISEILTRPTFYKILEPKIQPSEAYSKWAKADPGLLNPCRSLESRDVTKVKKNKMRRLVKNKSRDNRFLCKITGWSMIDYFDEIFPHSMFIHILRDGRAVVNSLLHVDFWEGWEGVHNWRWGFKEEYQKEIERHDNSFAAIAALQWKLITDEINRSKNNIASDRFLEINYEGLVDEPVNVVKESVEFTGLDWTERIERIISSYKTKNMNYKWEENLSEKEKEVLNDMLREPLKRYGYDI